MQNIAFKINNRFFDGSFDYDVFFSGRDEDFINIVFAKDTNIIKVQIELENHVYKITGKEKIDCNINGQELNETHFAMTSRLNSDSVKASIISFTTNQIRILISVKCI